MTYTIEKDTHYALPPYPLIAFGKSDVFDVFFYDNCKHIPIEDDVHKLWGRSNTFDRQKDSLRIGWRASNKFIELFAYEHLPILGYGKERITFLQKISTSQSITIRINYNSKSSSIFINDVLMYKSDFVSNQLAFRCRPYYGGNIVAPHKMRIKITWII
jgi:hypothetical protein